MKTDLELKHAVTAELERDAAVDAEEIGVEVSDGVVTLSGHLLNFGQKIAAEQAAQRVPGVEALVQIAWSKRLQFGLSEFESRR